MLYIITNNIMHIAAVEYSSSPYRLGADENGVGVDRVAGPRMGAWVVDVFGGWV